MALGTPTIETLRTERLRSLASLGIETRENIEALRNGARSRAENIFRDLDILDSLEDPAWQREAYGDWNNDFVFASSGAGGIETGMKALRNSRFARAQRIFSEPKHWAVPRIGRGDHQRMSLKPALFSPGLIPDKLLTDVGFVDEAVFEDLRGDPIARIGKKREYVDAVKLMMEHATPLDPRQQRLLRLDAPAEHAAAQYPAGTPTIPKGAQGSILYVRERIGKERGPRRLQVQFYDSAYAALRKTFHEDESYAREIDGLADCQRDVERMLWRLNEGYRKGTAPEEKRRLWTEAEAILVRYNRMLEPCFAHDKREAHGFLLGASDLRDARGKENISKVMAKMTAALARVAHRFDEMKPKGGFNAQDRQVLHAQIQREEGTLLSVRRSLQETARDFADGTTDEATVARALEPHVRDLERVRLKPLALPADAMIRQIQSLYGNTGEELSDRLLAIHATGKIQGLITSLEWIRGRIAQSGSLDFAREARFVASVEHAFTTEQLFPGKNVPYLEEIMEPLEERIGELRAFLERHASSPPATEESAKEATEALDALLDGFDTTTALAAITDGLPEARPYEPAFRLK